MPECIWSATNTPDSVTSTVLPNFSQPFCWKQMLLRRGIRAVLAQKNESDVVHLIAYPSRTLLHEKSYGISEMEGLGVLWAVEHFRHFLYGHKCDVYTDHKALKLLINTPHIQIGEVGARPTGVRPGDPLPTREEEFKCWCTLISTGWFRILPYFWYCCSIAG